MSKNVLITYIYPSAKKYLHSFIDCINLSTTNDFEVIFFNDGVENLNSNITGLKVNYRIIDVSGSINWVRYKSFEILRELNIENIIFQDIDDKFSKNRIEININLLNSNDIVITDLNVVKNNEIVEQNIWRNRLSILDKITYLAIIKYNFLGLGNTAIKKKLLNGNLLHNEDVIAYDWFIFYQILRNNSLKVEFTSACTVDYLQHENNIAGLNQLNSIERLKHVYNVKLKHYEALLCFDYGEIQKELEQLKEIEIDNKWIVNNNKTFKQSDLFWWEEI